MTTTTKERAKALDADSARALRAAVDEIAGEDAAMRDRLLLRVYERFLRGMAAQGYQYTHHSKDAASAILGLPDDDEA